MNRTGNSKVISADTVPQVHVIGPDGSRHGPFGGRHEALGFGNLKWPDCICGDREEDPGAWEVQISTLDKR